MVLAHHTRHSREHVFVCNSGFRGTQKGRVLQADGLPRHQCHFHFDRAESTDGLQGCVHVYRPISFSAKRCGLKEEGWIPRQALIKPCIFPVDDGASGPSLLGSLSWQGFKGCDLLSSSCATFFPPKGQFINIKVCSSSKYLYKYLSLLYTICGNRLISLLTSLPRLLPLAH